MKVSIDTCLEMEYLLKENKSRIESKCEVEAYIENLKYALNNGARIEFQKRRRVDDNRNVKFTNEYTVNSLFPNENPVDAIKRELMTLTVEEYMRTVQDLRFPKKSEMREFGKIYNDVDDV